MAVSKLSQITASPSNPALADEIVGVHNGNTDYLYTYQQMVLGQIATYTGDHTLALTDIRTIIEMDAATTNQLIIPLNASVAFPIGSWVMVVQVGAGTTLFAPAVGVTLQSAYNATQIAAQYGSALLYKRATNTWLLTGYIM